MMLIFRCETCACVVVDGFPFICSDCGNKFCSKHKDNVKQCKHVKYTGPSTSAEDEKSAAEVEDEARHEIVPPEDEDEEEWFCDNCGHPLEDSDYIDNGGLCDDCLDEEEDETLEDDE